MDGQISIAEFENELNKHCIACTGCICRNCLMWWSGRCPYGGCYDNFRAKTNPYDKEHPDKTPRKGWSDWKTDQAYWCRGGVFYSTSHCRHYVKYTGSRIKYCIKANVQAFQDGYIECPIVDSVGCERCYEELNEKWQQD